MISSALVTAALAASTATEEEAHALPAEPWVFGVVSLIVFAALFAVTWAFRSVGHKH